jgi:predicted site-specific integrase-resolvase
MNRQGGAVEGFLTVDESAERTGVAPGTVRRWLDDPRVPLTKHKTANGRVMVEERELDAWDRARRTPVIVTLAAASPAVSGVAS